VNLFQFRSHTTMLVALEDLDVIFDVQLLEQPDKTLSARLFEPDVSLVCVGGPGCLGCAALLFLVVEGST
jgi:hypothetical protein